MSTRNVSLGAPALPQVNLLPPEVRSARSVRRVKGWLAVSVGLSLLVVAAGYLLGTMEKGQANDELDAARRETDTLLAEQAQYAEVPRVLQALRNARSADDLARAGEVRWDEYLGAIEAVIGQNVSMETLAVQQVLPTEETVPLDPPAIAVLTFTGRATTVPDGPALSDALERLPGLESARVEVVAIAGIENTRWWDVTITVRVTTDALTEVREALEAAGEDDAAADDEATDDAAAEDEGE